MSPTWKFEPHWFDRATVRSMITASMKTWRRGHVELVDDAVQLRIVALRRGNDDRVRRLVGADLDASLEDPHGRRRPLAPRRPGRGRPRLCGSGDDLVQRLRQLGRVGVLEREDVDLPFSGLRQVETLDEVEDAHIGPLGADDDDGVRPVVSDDLRDVNSPPVCDRPQQPPPCRRLRWCCSFTSNRSLMRLAMSDALA